MKKLFHGPMREVFQSSTQASRLHGKSLPHHSHFGRRNSFHHALILLSMALILAPFARAQSTTVTATVIDPNTNPYANGTVSAFLVLATGQPIPAGAQLSSGPFILNSSGFFSITLFSPATYTFTICGTPVNIGPRGNPTPNSVCFPSPPIAISGGAQDITATLNAAALILGPNPTGGSVSGCIPGTPVNSIQKNSGGGCVASGLVDDGTTITEDRDHAFKGPNPWADVRRYGGRSVNVAVAPQIPGITGNSTSGLTTLPISAPSTFQNNDYVVAFGAGAPHAMATPGAPTVTPSNAAGPTGTGLVVNSPAGAISNAYCIVAENKSGGLTPCSPTGTTATAQTLGSRSVAITSCSRVIATITCLTAPHAMSAGSYIYLTQTSDGTFGGTYISASVPDNTHFTFIAGFDTLSGAPASSTGGTVFWFNSNHLAWSSVAGAFRYWIFGRTGGSLAPIGVSKPDGNGTNNDGALYWDDFGSPMMDNFSAAYYIPSTPPVAATSNHLVSKITGGGGTSTLTLVDPAGTSVTGATVLYDGGPTILAAAQAGVAYIPSVFSTVVNSYLTLPVNASICLSGSVYLNDTIEVQSSAKLTGNCVPQAGFGPPAFGFEGAPTFFVNRANPGFYGMNAGGIQLTHLNFASLAKNNARLAIIDHGGPFTASWNSWVTDNGGNGQDYMGVGLELRGLSSDTIFPFFLTYQLFSASLPQLNGISATPELYCNSCGSGAISNVQMNRRGIVFRPGQGYDALAFSTEVREQGGITPLLTAIAPTGASGGLSIVASVFNMDTMAHPLFANLIGANTSINVEASESPSGDGVSAPPIVSGYPTTVTGINPGQGYTSLIFGSNFSNNSVQVNGTLGNVGFGMAQPAAPGVVLSAGGAVPIGTWLYQTSALDVNGDESILGNNSTSVVVTGGNQTVTITPPACPVGATSYWAYRHNPGSGIGRVATGSPAACGVNTVDTFGFTLGPGGPFGQAIQAGASAAGLQGNILTLTGGGFKSSASGTFTANRAFAVPDRDYTVIQIDVFTNLGTPANGNFIYCSNCTIANPCAGGGTGALAKRLNGVWVCN